MTSRNYTRRARERQLQTGECHAESLLQVRAGEVRGRLPEEGPIDVAELARKTGLRQPLVIEMLTYLARSGVQAARPCGTCRKWGAEADCERCGEENHAACLAEVAGRQVCLECAACMEGSGI